RAWWGLFARGHRRVQLVDARDDLDEGLAVGGQGIFGSRRDLVEGLLVPQAVVGEPPQPLGQDVVRNALDASLQPARTVHAAAYRLEHRDGPLATDHLLEALVGAAGRIGLPRGNFFLLILRHFTPFRAYPTEKCPLATRCRTKIPFAVSAGCSRATMLTN